jgi:diadenylate cyclase
MREIGSALYAFMDKYLSWIDKPKIGVTDVIEIIIIAFVLYHIMVWVKNTRAWMLFKGIIVILIFLLIAALFQMNTILWLSGKVVNIAAIALVIIFQPELRNALERLGRKNFLTAFFSFDFQKASTVRFSEKTITEIVKACYEMGKVKTGALIVIERDVMLNEYIRTGISLDSLVSSQLLINIFEHNTPLHDGAIIVRGDRIVAATCYLPLSDNMELSKELGTRHRAAVGVSEVSDSMTIIVSEETGAVSLAVEGTLYRNIDADFLKSKLRFAAKLSQTTEPYLEKLKRRLKHVTKTDKADNK